MWKLILRIFSRISCAYHPEVQHYFANRDADLVKRKVSVEKYATERDFEYTGLHVTNVASDLELYMMPLTDPSTESAAAVSDLATGALDLSVLEKMVGGNAVKFKKFALLFVSSMTDVMVQIDAAVAKNDIDALAAMGHRAKSTAMNVGAFGLSGQCQLLEKAAHAGERENALAIAQGLKPMFIAICAMIDLRLADA